MLTIVLAATLAAPRFFLIGDGTFALLNAHTGERATVRYRQSDGSYDAEALARIRHLFRSRGDGREGDVSLRLVELLAYLQEQTGKRPFTLMSGYRSPQWNQDLKDRGRAVAGGSLHTEGLAADLAFPRGDLPRLWHRVRDLDCCGAGYYAKEGFLHVDVGRPRYWEAATSGVDKNLSAGNARIFVRTEFDRYARGEPMTVTFHAMTEPPVRVAREARLGGAAVTIESDQPLHDGCFEIASDRSRVRVTGAEPVARATLELRTCEPRIARTPETIESNPIEVR
jgi:uncharacterized protein YcbK (DUF882 family)